MNGFKRFISQIKGKKHKKEPSNNESYLVSIGFCGSYNFGHDLLINSYFGSQHDPVALAYCLWLNSYDTIIQKSNVEINVMKPMMWPIIRKDPQLMMFFSSFVILTCRGDQRDSRDEIKKWIEVIFKLRQKYPQVKRKYIILFDKIEENLIFKSNDKDILLAESKKDFPLDVPINHYFLDFKNGDAISDLFDDLIGSLFIQQ